MVWRSLSKPSVRVKLRKDDVRDGRRYIELSRPKDVLALKNWLPQVFARKLGLLSDQSDLVRLFINQKYAGVYVRSMRPGQALAIAVGPQSVGSHCTWSCEKSGMPEGA